MEEWTDIDDFPNYAVSNLGRVRNDFRKQTMSITQNQSGLAVVGLTRDGMQYKRSLALLVADRFLYKPYERYNTPINLNGDRLDCTLGNLLWRPRTFATAYHKQFATMSPRINKPILNIKTGQQYDDLFDAATQNGLLFKDLFLAIHNKTYVWPTFQEFEIADGDY